MRSKATTPHRSSRKPIHARWDARQPFRTVLAPTDFSDGAAKALARVFQLPLAAGGRVHIVHILSVDGPAGSRARLETQAKASLRQLVSRAGKLAKAVDGLVVTSEILVGRPFVEIIRSSRAIDAELIVLGRHGRRPVRDMFLGSTVGRVVRKGDVPVLIVNLPAEGPYRRPIIATDLGDASRRTFQVAMRVVDAQLKEFTVVHAFNVPFEGLMTPPLSSRTTGDYRLSFRQSAIADVATYLKQYGEVGEGWNRCVRHGDARAVILAEALRRRADLIAVGTHGGSGLAHALIGSVAEWIISAASCDVLVARPVPFRFEMP